MNFSRILVPVDFSNSSLKALKLGCDLAQQFGAELHLFHSYPCSGLCDGRYHFG